MFRKSSSRNTRILTKNNPYVQESADGMRRLRRHAAAFLLYFRGVEKEIFFIEKNDNFVVQVKKG